MKLRSAILGMASMAALAAFSATGAMADSNFAGNIGAGYNHVSGGGADANGWNINGGGQFGVGSAIHIEADGSYDTISDSGIDLNTSRISGAAFWQGDQFRVGAAIGYADFDLDTIGSFSSTNYGAFGEFFVSDQFTLRAKGGWLTVSDGGPDGTYLGGGATFYAMPNLAVSGGVSYVSLDSGGGDGTVWNANAEYLFSETTPISGIIGYSSSDTLGSTVSTWSIGIKFYTNGNGASTLVDRQRSGTVGAGLTGSGLTFP